MNATDEEKYTLFMATVDERDVVITHQLILVDMFPFYGTTLFLSGNIQAVNLVTETEMNMAIVIINENMINMFNSASANQHS